MGVIQRFKGNIAFAAPPLGEAGTLSFTLNWAGGTIVGNGTYLFTGSAAYAFAISSLDASIGSAGGSLMATVQINTMPVVGLTALAISAVPKTRFLAGGTALLVNPGDIVAALISVSGAPTDTYLVLNGVKI